MKENFKILNGDRKILISAPHAVEQTREGKIKFSEEETEIIAEKLNKLGYPAIIKTVNVGDDANYDMENQYKRELQNYCKKHDIRFVLDLHQLSIDREMDFCLCTGGKDDKNLLQFKYVIPLIKSYIEVNKFIATVNEPYHAPERTVSGFCKKHNIPSLQLEINSRLISSFYEATHLEEIIEIIKEILNLIEKEIKID